MRLIWNFIIVLVAFPFAAHSTEVHYALGFTLTHYENINLEPVPADSEMSEVLRGSVSIVENTANLVANLDAIVETIKYNNEQASDQNQGQLIANALWVISPSRFEWYLSNTFTQTAIDPFESNTPGNRQNVNAFSTGPNYLWRVNPRNNINLEARVEDYAYESLAIDNQRLSSAIRWSYDINSSANAALNFEAETVKFSDDNLNSDFNRNDVYLSVDYLRGLNALEMEIGATKVVNDSTADINESRFLFALENARTRTSSIRLEYERMVSDTSTELLSLGAADLNDPDFESTSADTFVDKTARLIYRKELNSGTVDMTFFSGNTDYTSQNELDQSDKGLNILYSWQLHERSELIFEGRRRRNVYDILIPYRQDDDVLYRLAYEYRARRNVNVSVNFISQERESTILSESYEDKRVGLTLEYLSR